MSKLLIEKNLFQRLIDTFFKAKAQGKEDVYISKIKHKNPKVAAAFEKMNKGFVKSSLELKSLMKDLNLDTSEIDNFLNTYYDKA